MGGTGCEGWDHAGAPVPASSLTHPTRRCPALGPASAGGRPGLLVLQNHGSEHLLRVQGLELGLLLGATHTVAQRGFSSTPGMVPSPAPSLPFLLAAFKVWQVTSASCCRPLLHMVWGSGPSHPLPLPHGSPPQDLLGVSVAASANVSHFSIQQTYNCPFMSPLEVTPGWPG